MGRRIRKQRLSGGHPGARPVGYDYLWSGDQLTEEVPLYADGTLAYDESVHWLYTLGALTPLARYEKGQLHYVVSDHMGTPRELLTEQGNVVWSGRLNTWGGIKLWQVAANDGDKLRCNLRFAGQYADEESGLHYNRYRYYDSETGQYLSPDPIGLAGGLNSYSYVPNPLKWVDPLGLCKTSGTNNKGLESRGYKPQPGERTREGYMNNNISPDREVTLHTKSPGFNNNKGNTGGQFKRYGVESHGGLSPHVHQPTRNVSPKGDIYGSQGTKISNGDVTSPTNKDIKQLYLHFKEGRYNP